MEIFPLNRRTRIIRTLLLAVLSVAASMTGHAQTTASEWQAKAIQKYPHLAVHDSTFNKQFVAAYTERHKTAPAFFLNPRWPLILADELAAQTPQAGSGAAAVDPPVVSGSSASPNQDAPAPTPPTPATVDPKLAEYEADSIPGGSGLMAAKFRWWAPANGKVRGVLVLIPGRGSDGRGMAGDQAWKALATQIQFGIVGCFFEINKDDPYTYQGDPGGRVSGVINKSIDAILARNGQSLKNPPLAFWGHSAGGNVTQQYMSHFANRVVAAVLMRATNGPGDLAPGKADVPTLIFVGKKDKPEWVAAALARYEKGHAAHAAWTLALNPKEGHEVGKTQALSIAQIAAAVNLRLPASAIAGDSAKLQKINKQSGWLGDTESYEIAESNQFRGKKADATWLLDEATAKAWQEYLRE